MDSRAVISFAERVLALLDQGKFTSTYKFAVLLAMMDLSMEQFTRSGMAPDSFTTRQLAEKVIQLYWQQTNPFEQNLEPRVLLQNVGRNGAQAEIVSEIAAFRSHSKVGNFAPYFSAKFQDRSGFNKLVDKVEWKLIEMPLPRLQRIGNVNTPFIYSISWGEKIKKSTVNSYQRGKSREFNNLIYLKPNVGDYFIQLNGLLRPLIQQQWASRVAETNRLDEARLQSFLFSASRTSTVRINQQLTELQNGKCFYCHKPIGTSDKKKPEVDHFIPWSRYPNDTLSNFVIAHNECNAAKKDFLACEEHLENWMLRINDGATISQLQSIANDNRWELGKDMSENVSRAIYLNLKDGMELWKEGLHFEKVDYKALLNTMDLLNTEKA